MAGADRSSLFLQLSELRARAQWPGFNGLGCSAFDEKPLSRLHTIVVAIKRASDRWEVGSGLFIRYRPNGMTYKAIIWDYDGTLVDTRAKNFSVTKKIMRRLMGMKSGEYPALQSLEAYIRATRTAKNWRELYRSEFHMNEYEIDEAGKLWTEHQLSDDSEVTFFEGIEEAIRSLSRYPNLIFSQNSRSNIAQVLERKDLLRCFVDIVGYEELASGNQKPAPDGLLLCINKMKATTCEHVFFIGDHETDTLCGHNANEELRNRNSGARIINVAAFYGAENDASDWRIKPDHIVTSPPAIVDYVENY